jgi:formylglycine-generating enzyme required for sulfatase activity
VPLYLTSSKTARHDVSTQQSRTSPSNTPKQAAPEGTNWLLAIAIDKYQHKPLNNCVRDAKAIAKQDSKRRGQPAYLLYRVIRGRFWFSLDINCRVSRRGNDDADFRFYDLGFRLAGY